jgi:hypothetical protein
MAEFDELMEYDPTPKKVYLQWLINQAAKDLILSSGLEKIKNALIVYDKHKRKFEHTDINKYISWEDLVDESQIHSGSQSGKEEKKNLHNKAKDESTEIYKGSMGSIYVPKTEYASCMLGRGTKWCTTGNKDNKFGIYNKLGPLYIIQTRDNKKYQLHIETDECVDELDNEIEASTLKRKYPWIFKYIKVTEKHVRKNASSIQWMINPPERLQMDVIKQDPWNVLLIDNATDRVKIEATKQRGFNFKYCFGENAVLSEPVQIAAVKRDPHNIMFIKNPTEKAQLAALSDKAALPVIRFIKNPTEKVQLYVVGKSPSLIHFIDRPTDKVKKLAGKK